ncbi:MAG: GDSL-type esterase/lipase family protein [Symbiobacteriaceae bacterium]|nr:GDSL-type esterase/lipase family protein [Symbiobacteriaceae bacterium]
MRNISADRRATPKNSHWFKQLVTAFSLLLALAISLPALGFNPLMTKKSSPSLVTATVEDDYFTNALFIGDSLTHGLDLYKVIPQATFVASTGINLLTMRTSRLFTLADGSTGTMIQKITSLTAPGKIYLMLGSNGINWIAISRMVEEYGDLVDELKDTFPKAIIYVQSMLPAQSYVAGSQPGFAASNVQAYNKALKAMAAEKEVTYLDVQGVFSNSEGYLKAEHSSGDGIHITAAGYRLWYDYLKKNALVEVATVPRGN